MAQKTGQFVAFKNQWVNTTPAPIALGITMAAQEYPTQIKFSGLNLYLTWRNAYSRSDSASIYLCDTSGNNRIKIYETSVQAEAEDVSFQSGGSRTFNISETDAKKLKGKSLAIVKNANNGIYFGVISGTHANITITTKSDAYDVTVNQATGGTVTADKASALVGSTVTLTVTPTEGYRLTGWTTVPANLEIENNQFVMPEQAVTITPSWEKIDYIISTQTNPAGAGTVTAPETGQAGDTISISQTPAEGYSFSNRWTLSNGGTVEDGSFIMPASNITVTANYTANTYNISKDVSPAGAGSVAAPATGVYGTTISIGQSAAIGYTFDHWELSSGGSVSSSSFVMPAGNVTITAVFTRNAYAITTQTDPEDAGTITAPATAGYQDTVNISQTPGEGFYFNGWTLSNGGEVSSGSFTMPDGPITVTANYIERATAEADQTINGGKRWQVKIKRKTADIKGYELILSFPCGIYLRQFYSGASTVTISFPSSETTAWANYVTTDRQATGGTLTIHSYKNSNYTELIGTYVLEDLVYNVPDDAGPQIVSKSAERALDTIGGVQRAISAEGYDFADLGCFVQNHGGAEINATVRDKYQAAITSVRVQVIGYEGAMYDQTFTGNSTTMTVNMITGNLTKAGLTNIKITATNSRGMTTERMVFTDGFTVNQYTAPIINSFEVWRCDASGDPDETGTVAKYGASYSWTQAGTNAVTRTVSVYGIDETVTTDEDWILPSSRQSFPTTDTAEITYTVADLLETTSITVRLGSGKFILHFNASGDSVAIGHAVQETPTAGKGYTGTFEVDENMEIWVGDPTHGSMTLKDYILAVVNGTI